MTTDGAVFPLKVRAAERDEVPRILELVAHSRGIMRANGNHVQWDGYPGADLISADIEQGIGHVVTLDGVAVGYFALLLEPEPTYACIEEGLWLDDTTPYGTIHRLACAEGVHGIARCVFAWCEARCASVRVDTHRSNAIMLHIFQRHGYTRCGVVYMRDGTPREAYQKMTYPMVTPSLRHYVEAAILPRYNLFDAAHGLDHVLRVMAQSMELAGRYPGLNRDMVYTIAACHDIGIAEGRERHHLASGRMIREDGRLQEWFSPQEVETMAEAAEDHRASSSREPRSLYGSIVAEADRDIEPLTVVRRTVEYGLSHYPGLDKEGHWQRTLQHLHEKYAEGGYLKLFIPCSRNGSQLQKLRALIADEPRLRQVFEEEIQRIRESENSLFR